MHSNLPWLQKSCPIYELDPWTYLNLDLKWWTFVNSTWRIFSGLQESYFSRKVVITFLWYGSLWLVLKSTGFRVSEVVSQAVYILLALRTCIMGYKKYMVSLYEYNWVNQYLHWIYSSVPFSLLQHLKTVIVS